MSTIFFPLNSVEINGHWYIELVPAKMRKLKEIPEVLPPCAWCNAPTVRTELSIIQLGMFATDSHKVVCRCDVCTNITIFSYFVREDADELMPVVDNPIRM